MDGGAAAGATAQFVDDDEEDEVGDDDCEPQSCPAGRCDRSRSRDESCCHAGLAPVGGITRVDSASVSLGLLSAGGVAVSPCRAAGGGAWRKPPGAMRCDPAGLRLGSAVHRGRGSVVDGLPASSGGRRTGSSVVWRPSASVGRASSTPLRPAPSSCAGGRGGSGGLAAGASPASGGGERCSRRKSSRSVTASILTACPWFPPVLFVVCERSSRSLRSVRLGERGGFRRSRQRVVLRHRIGAAERGPGGEHPDQRPRCLSRLGW